MRLLGAAAVGDLVLHHLEDGVDGLLLGGVDEAAGVDDEDVGVFGAGGELRAAAMEQAHHDLGVDEVLGAAERDEADRGAVGYLGSRGRRVSRVGERLTELDFSRFGADGEGFAWFDEALLGLRRKAIWSLRLRLHSGLRQRGGAFSPTR